MLTSSPAVSFDAEAAHRIRGILAVISNSLELIRLASSRSSVERSIERAERGLVSLRKLAEEIEHSEH